MLSLATLSILAVPALLAQDDGQKTRLAGRLELLAVQRGGDPLAMVLVPGTTEALAVEGSQLLRIDLSQEDLGEGAVRWRIPLDAPPIDLACTKERLYVAGGDAGLWRVNLNAPNPAAVLVAKPPAECTAVAVDAEKVLVAFTDGTRAGLWILDEADLTLRWSIDLPRGTPFAIAMRDERAWLALGEGGVVCVDLQGEEKPLVRAGPTLSHLPVPAGFQLAAGLARDLALGEEHLYVAADSAGLVVIDLDQPWGTDTPLEVRSLQLPGRPAYAQRVAASGRRVAVGTLRGPARAADGTPYGQFGAIGLALEVGGVKANRFPRGDAERLHLFEHEDGQLMQRGRAELPACGWRSLELGAERLYAMHLLRGLVVYDATQPELPVVAQRRSRGLPAVDGGFALSDPELLLFGVDSEGALTGGLHRLEGDGRIEAVPGTEEALTHQLTIGARWLDEKRGCEWFLGGHGHSWWLQRLEPGQPPGYASWEVRPPKDPDGLTGNTYFNSAVDGDLLLLTRSGSRFGLLTASASALTARASALEPGSVLELEALHTLETHPKGGRGLVCTWRVEVARLPDARRLALVAAGTETGLEHPEGGPAQVLVYELASEPGTAPRLVARLRGEAPRGMAMAVESLQVGERLLGIAVGLSGQLNVFDVTHPERSHHISTWTAPANPYSARPEPMLDLAVDEETATAFVAAGRAGVGVLDLSDPLSPRMMQAIDTPGWAVGICFDERNGRARVAVGDQKGGLRVFSWTRSPEATGNERDE
jgi:hypothetical protein